MLCISKALLILAKHNTNVALLANGSRVNFAPSVSADNRTLTLGSFSLGNSLGLPANTVVMLAITHSVTDLSGNALADYESQFTAAADATRPSVVNQRPGHGATGVGVSTGAVLFVNEPLNAGTGAGALHVTANGQLVSWTVSVLERGGSEFPELTSLAPQPGVTQSYIAKNRPLTLA